MDLPHSKQRQKYIDEIKDIEAELKESTSAKVPAEKLEKLQEQLDKLADQYQYKEEIGSARYKLYELQAFLYYFGHKDDEALDFIGQAIEMRGTTYPKAEKLRQSISTGATGPKKDGILFFHKSPVTVFWLSFLTLSLYNIYWFYKHWRTIRVSTGVRTWPIMSALFQVFTAYSLFKRIRDNAGRHGYRLLGIGWLATVYIVTIVVSNAISRTEIGGAAAGTVTQFTDIAGLIGTILFGVALALIPVAVQKAANAHDEAVLGKRHTFRKIYAGEIIFAVIGITLFVFSMYQYGHDIIANQYPRGTQSAVRAASAKADSLRTQYDTCNADLTNRHDRVDVTDTYAVNSYNNDLASCENTRQELNKAVEKYNWLAGYTN